MAPAARAERLIPMPALVLLLTDLALHTDEIHTKLVDIMRERLGAALAALPAELQQVRRGRGYPACM